METGITELTALESAEEQFRSALERRNEQVTITKQAITELAEVTVQCGVYCGEMRTLIGERRFDQWFTEKKFGCSLAAAKSFIRFSERRQALQASFRKTLLSLPECQNDRRTEPQKKIPRASCEWLTSIMHAVEQVTLAIEKCPIEDWPEAHRDTLIDSLRPLAELYEKWHDD